MGRILGMALAGATLLLGLPALAQQPPAVAAQVAEAMAECRSAGGNPSLAENFETRADLNGDGQADYLLDYDRLICRGADSFFCGSAGCPLVAMLSGPGGHRAVGLGHVRAWSLQQGVPPVLVLDLHGSACGRVGAAECQRRVAWNGREFAAVRAGATPPRASAPAPVAPAAPPGGGAKGAVAGPAPAPAAPGNTWQVRSGADGRPIAVVAGPGVVRALTVLCHEGVPVAALALRARPPAGPVTFGLAGRSGRASAPLRPGGGDVWFADLRGSALAGILAGADAAVEVLINGGMQGRLSLQGSSRAVREALAPCSAS